MTLNSILYTNHVFVISLVWTTLKYGHSEAFLLSRWRQTPWVVHSAGRTTPSEQQMQYPCLINTSSIIHTLIMPKNTHSNRSTRNFMNSSTWWLVVMSGWSSAWHSSAIIGCMNFIHGTHLEPKTLRIVMQFGVFYCMPSLIVWLSLIDCLLLFFRDINNEACGKLLFWQTTHS